MNSARSLSPTEARAWRLGDEPGAGVSRRARLLQPITARGALLAGLAVILLATVFRLVVLAHEDRIHHNQIESTLALVDLREQVEVTVFRGLMALNDVAEIIHARPGIGAEALSALAVEKNILGDSATALLVAPNLRTEAIAPAGRLDRMLGADLRRSSYGAGLVRAVERDTPFVSVRGQVWDPDLAWIIFTPVFVMRDGERVPWGVIGLAQAETDLMSTPEVAAFLEQHDVLLLQLGDDEQGDTVVLGDPDVLDDPHAIRTSFDFAYADLAILARQEAWGSTASYLTTETLLVVLTALLIFLSSWYMLHLGEARRKAQERLTDAIRSLDAGFAMFDDANRLLYFNQRFKDSYHAAADAVRSGVLYEDLLREGVARGVFLEAKGKEVEWARAQLAALRSGHSVEEQPCSDGRWYRKAEHRSPDGTLVVLRSDITDLRGAKDRAEEASMAKTAFLSVLNHELRTPLTVILGAAGLMRNFRALNGAKVQGAEDTARADAPPAPGADPEFFASMAKRVEDSAQHLLSLVNQILDYSSIDVGYTRVSIQPVEMSELVGPVLQQTEILAKNKGLRFEYDITPCRVLADTLRARQILLNLLGNAVKFTPEGVVSLTAGPHEGEIAFWVRDTGPGIPPEEAEPIFKPFHQADSSASRAAGGTGLGLSVARELARLQHGSLVIDTTAEVGSTFVLTLPSAEADAVEDDLQDCRPAETGPRFVWGEGQIVERASTASVEPAMLRAGTARG